MAGAAKVQSPPNSNFPPELSGWRAVQDCRSILHISSTSFVLYTIDQSNHSYKLLSPGSSPACTEKTIVMNTQPSETLVLNSLHALSECSILASPRLPAREFERSAPLLTCPCTHTRSLELEDDVRVCYLNGVVSLAPTFRS